MNTTISISKKLCEEIKEFGKMGDTYESILQRVIKYAKKEHLKELLLDTSDCISLSDAEKQ